MKILLLAYACQPGQGAEGKNGWEWAIRLSRKHDVTVLTHVRGRESILRALEACDAPSLQVRFVQLPRMLDPTESLSADRFIRIRFARAKYALWQFWAYREASKLLQTERFDFVQHVTWASIATPTLGWLLKVPFVLGPAGGGHTAPLRMGRYLGWKGVLAEAIRNVRVHTMRLNPIVRLMATRSKLVLASNLETESLLKQLGAKNVRLMLDAAVDEAWAPPSFPEKPMNEVPVVLWIGRFEPHKALNLAIEAFAESQKYQLSKLWILGDGPLKEAAIRLAQRLQVQDRVFFKGWIPHREVPAMLRQSDVLLFTSLRDTCPQPVLEAMSWGLPVVTLDHQGLRLHPETAVLKVAVTGPSDTKRRLAQALGTLLASRELRLRMGGAAWELIQAKHLWLQRIEGVESAVSSFAPSRIAPSCSEAVSRA